MDYLLVLLVLGFHDTYDTGNRSVGSMYVNVDDNVYKGLTLHGPTTLKRLVDEDGSSWHYMRKPMYNSRLTGYDNVTAGWCYVQL